MYQIEVSCTGLDPIFDLIKVSGSGGQGSQNAHVQCTGCLRHKISSTLYGTQSTDCLKLYNSSTASP